MTGQEIPTVLVDLYNVLANFDSGVERQIEQNYPEIAIVRPRNNFYIHQDYAEEHYAAIKGIWQASGFLRDLEMVDGAVEGWQRLVEEGVHPRVCSSPPSPIPECTQEGRDWLEQYMVPDLGKGVLDEAIFDRDKSKFGALALIDDKPEVTGAESASWRHIVFDAPYNAISSSTLRLHGWHDPELPNLLNGLIEAEI